MTNVDLLKGNIIKSIIIFALPLLVSYVFQQLYNAVDTVIVGNFLKESSLAAIGACTALYDLLIGFGIGFGNGMSIVAARAFGAGDSEKLKKVAATSVIITFIVTIFIVILTKIFLKEILILLDTPEEIIEESYSYISLITSYCGVLFAYNLLSGLLRAIGNSFMPLVFLIISSLLNIVLDILFMTKLMLGIKGAAIATIIAQLVSAILCLVYILKYARNLIPSKVHFVPERKIYIDLLGQGLSMAFMSSLVNSGTVVLQSAINNLGTLTIAGHVSARKIFTIATIPTSTLGMASSTFVSQNFGAGQIDRIKKGVKDSIFITIVWAFVLIILMPIFSRTFISLISGSSNETVLKYGASYITFMAPFFLILGGLIVIRNSLQGLGSKLLPLTSSVIELIGKILFTMFVIPKLGAWGVIICEPLIWCVMFLQLLYVYIKHPALKETK